MRVASEEAADAACRWNCAFYGSRYHRRVKRNKQVQMRRSKRVREIAKTVDAEKDLHAWTKLSKF